MKHTSKNDGFSLVEVMIAMTVFSITAAGIASSALLSGKIAYSNIYRNTAFTVAQGYGEQLKSIQYSTIESALRDPETYTIPTKGLSQTPTGSSQFDDPLVFGQRIEKEIVIDVEELDDGALQQKTMTMWITTSGRNLLTESEEVKAIEITLFFEWDTANFNGQNTQEDSIRIVKTDVTEF